MTAPLEKTPAWTALESHAKEGLDIVALNGSEPRLKLAIDRVAFDFSLQRASQKTLEKLLVLAGQQDVSGNLKRMFAGEKVNVTEDRAAWHTALRDPNPPAEVADALERMREISEKIRGDKTVTDIVHIGIGGSDLGPRLVCAALGAPKGGPRLHFVANVDESDLDTALARCDAGATMAVVVSKTFTTQETLANLQRLRGWLKDDTRIIGVTADAAKAADQGIAAGNILPMAQWVNGRFSLWSSVGVSVALAYGFEVFSDLLRGAHAADRHMLDTPLDRNPPVLMALYGIWNRNFLGASAHAVFPYSEPLSHLVAYLQQLEMESNGKRVTREGAPCGYATAPVVFGGTGTNAQHAFMQALHQGTDVIPADFIGVLSPAQPVLNAHMRAQARALAEGGGQGHKACPGNRPSTTIWLPVLDAYNLGVLLAAYEHKTAVQSFVWNINAFDQFGVELGKTLAKELLAHKHPSQAQ